MRKRWTGLALALGLALAGCVKVVSDHPLSGDSDSVVDERLIGWWEVVPAQSLRGTEFPRYALVVGRLRGRDNALECVSLSLDDNDHVEIHRITMHTIRQGDSWHLSLHAEDDTFTLYRYTIGDAGKLVLEELEADGVATEIEAAKIAGRVERAPAESEAAGALEGVRLTARSDELREWIGGLGESVWQRTPEWESFRRLSRRLPTAK